MKIENWLLKITQIINYLKIDHWKLIIALLLVIMFVPNDSLGAALSKPANNLGLVGYWSFNDGAGTSATDFSGNGNAGTLTNGPTWVNGKAGKALSFDGVDDYVTVGNVLNFGEIDSFSYGGWFTLFSYDNWWAGMINKDQNVSNITGFGINTSGHLDAGFGKIYTTIGDGLGGAHVVTVSSDSTLNDGRWHHAFVVVNRTTQTLNFYIDGVLQSGSGASISSVGSLTSSSPLEFGRRGETTAYNGYPEVWSGKIDEVRIYNRALSATEVTSLYNTGGAKVQASFVPTSISGLSLWLKADSISGVVDGDTVATWPDSSGMGNDATQASAGDRPILKTNILNGKPIVRFNNKKMNYPTSVGSEESTWFIVFNKTGSPGFGESALVEDYLKFSVKSENSYGNWGFSTYSGVNSGTTVGNNFIVGSIVHYTNDDYDMYTNGGNKLTVGYNRRAVYGTGIGKNVWGHYHIGDIAEILRYDSALSTADVDKVRTYLNNKYHLYSGYKVVSVNKSQNSTGTSLDTGLVGLWSFNGPDISGTTAYDRSGQGNNGTLTNGPTPSIGKVGQALSFDGVDDYVQKLSAVNLPQQISDSWTFSIWVYPTVIEDGVLIFNWGNGNASNDIGGKRGILNHNNHIYFAAHASDTAVDPDFDTGVEFDMNAWNHVTATWNGTTLRMYKNGSSIGSTNLAGLANATGDFVQFGGPTGLGWQQYFTGKLDEARIYNRALSAAEVKLLYNMGK